MSFEYAFDDDFCSAYDEAPCADDLITAAVVAYQEHVAALPIQALLGDTDGSKLCADFDPQNVARPYVIVSQAHFDNEYLGQGVGNLVDKIIVQFLVFADARKQTVAILTALAKCYTAIDLDPAVGRPTVADNVAMRDLNHIDAYKGTLNLVYYVQKSCG